MTQEQFNMMSAVVKQIVEDDIDVEQIYRFLCGVEMKLSNVTSEQFKETSGYQIFINIDVDGLGLEKEDIFITQDLDLIDTFNRCTIKNLLVNSNLREEGYMRVSATATVTIFNDSTYEELLSDVLDYVYIVENNNVMCGNDKQHRIFREKVKKIGSK